IVQILQIVLIVSPVQILLDLRHHRRGGGNRLRWGWIRGHVHLGGCLELERIVGLDRKSTRLNSSHVKISYAVFCLKKKKYNDLLSHLTAHYWPLCEGVLITADSQKAKFRVYAIDTYLFKQVGDSGLSPLHRFSILI